MFGNLQSMAVNKKNLIDSFQGQISFKSSASIFNVVVGRFPNIYKQINLNLIQIEKYEIT